MKDRIGEWRFVPLIFVFALLARFGVELVGEVFDGEVRGFGGVAGAEAAEGWWRRLAKIGRRVWQIGAVDKELLGYRQRTKALQRRHLEHDCFAFSVCSCRSIETRA